MRIRQIEKLIKILENSRIGEIDITDLLGRRVRISKHSNHPSPTTGQTNIPPFTQTTETETKKQTSPDTALVAIRSPIVGTFYRAPAPDAPPYIDVGDIVKPGQVVCIVEAMKLLNEIECDIEGKIAKILVKNEDPVEYNQELFLVEPL